ncbi:hypothetical protein [Enterococcus innesii]|uniref:hypothetical protein n=1 Tax=Enterococcus innesii TaxID=2839759 RepID=UPI003D0DE708
MSEDEKALTDAYYWLSMYKSGAITEGVAMEKVKEAIFDQPQLNENQQKYLKELQYNRERLGNTHDALFFGLVDYEKRWNLNDEDLAPVMQAFSQWALEQEEE